MEHKGNLAKTVKKILIIDDHYFFREGLASQLRSAPDFEVAGEASSVHEGIEKARSLRPDIVLMDYSLPDGTGMDATEIILREQPECKIVFLTVSDDDEHLFSAMRSGAQGYLQKSIGSDALVASLRALERGEMALSRETASRIVFEFSHTLQERSDHQDAIDRLSPRELEVLCELQAGLTNQEIADRLSVSINTVKHHLRNIMSRLEVENRREASLIARQAGLKSKFEGTGRL